MSFADLKNFFRTRPSADTLLPLLKANYDPARGGRSNVNLLNLGDQLSVATAILNGTYNPAKSSTTFTPTFIQQDEKLKAWANGIIDAAKKLGMGVPEAASTPAPASAPASTPASTPAPAPTPAPTPSAAPRAAAAAAADVAAAAASAGAAVRDLADLERQLAEATRLLNEATQASALLEEELRRLRDDKTAYTAEKQAFVDEIARLQRVAADAETKHNAQVEELQKEIDALKAKLQEDVAAAEAAAAAAPAEQKGFWSGIIAKFKGAAAAPSPGAPTPKPAPRPAEATASAAPAAPAPAPAPAPVAPAPSAGGGGLGGALEDEPVVVSVTTAPALSAAAAAAAASIPAISITATAEPASAGIVKAAKEAGGSLFTIKPKSALPGPAPGAPITVSSDGSSVSGTGRSITINAQYYSSVRAFQAAPKLIGYMNAFAQDIKVDFAYGVIQSEALAITDIRRPKLNIETTLDDNTTKPGFGIFNDPSSEVASPLPGDARGTIVLDKSTPSWKPEHILNEKNNRLIVLFGVALVDILASNTSDADKAKAIAKYVASNIVVANKEVVTPILTPKLRQATEVLLNTLGISPSIGMQYFGNESKLMLSVMKKSAPYYAALNILRSIYGNAVTNDNWYVLNAVFTDIFSKNRILSRDGYGELFVNTFAQVVNAKYRVVETDLSQREQYLSRRYILSLETLQVDEPKLREDRKTVIVQGAKSIFASVFEIEGDGVTEEQIDQIIQGTFNGARYAKLRNDANIAYNQTPSRSIMREISSVTVTARPKPGCDITKEFCPLQAPVAPRRAAGSTGPNQSQLIYNPIV